MANKKQIPIRLTQESKQKLELLSKKNNISQCLVVEMLLKKQKNLILY